MWAVDGLAGVILGGVAGANTSRQVRKPRSLLWGSHEGQLTAWSGAPLEHMAFLYILIRKVGYKPASIL